MNFLPWNFPFSSQVSQERDENGERQRTGDRHLFLDLEDTIITNAMGGWSSVMCLNIPEVREWIQELKPETVNLFSFAIDDASDLNSFNRVCRDWLEQKLGVKFRLTPTMEDITSWLKKRKRLSILPMADIVEFWGKGDAFRLCIPALCEELNLTIRSCPQELILLDDSVEDELTRFPGGVASHVLNLETFLRQR